MYFVTTNSMLVELILDILVNVGRTDFDRLSNDSVIHLKQIDFAFFLLHNIDYEHLNDVNIVNDRNGLYNEINERNSRSTSSIVCIRDLHNGQVQRA